MEFLNTQGSAGSLSSGVSAGPLQGYDSPTAHEGITLEKNRKIKRIPKSLLLSKPSHCLLVLKRKISFEMTESKCLGKGHWTPAVIGC